MLGLYFYGAKWYDSYLNRWTSPDTVVPDYYNPQDWDRYNYARNNPLKYTDPDGHFPWLVLLGGLIYVATIPGDTGPYNVDPTTTAIEDAGLRMVDPVDWISTGLECLSGNCSSTDVMLGLLPIVNGGMDDAVDAARSVEASLDDAVGLADDVPIIKPGSSGGPTAGQPFPENVRQQAFANDPTKTCVWCGTPGTGTDVDHPIPRSQGGNATIDNAQLACPHCNRSRGARDFPGTPPSGYEGPWPPPHWQRGR